VLIASDLFVYFTDCFFVVCYSFLLSFTDFDNVSRFLLIFGDVCLFLLIVVAVC